MDVSDIFYFYFLPGDGKREREAPAWGVVFLRNPGGGGLVGDGVGTAEPGGGFWWGRANFFWRGGGAKFPPREACKFRVHLRTSKEGSL